MSMIISIRRNTSIHSTNITMRISIRGNISVHIKIDIGISINTNFTTKIKLHNSMNMNMFIRRNLIYLNIYIYIYICYPPSCTHVLCLNHVQFRKPDPTTGYSNGFRAYSIEYSSDPRFKIQGAGQTSPGHLES